MSASQHHGRLGVSAGCFAFLSVRRRSFLDMDKLGDLRSADALTDQEVISGIVDIVGTENALAANKYRLLAQFSRRGLNLKGHHSTPAQWLASGTRVTAGNAARQFKTADWLTGWPTVLDALAGGDIHSVHVKEIYDGFHHIRTADGTLTTEQLADAVADLLAAAFEKTSHEVKARAQELAHAFAQQARARFDRAQQEQRQNDKDETDDVAPDDVSLQPPAPPEPPIGPPPIPVSENPELNSFEIYVQANGRRIVRADLDAVLAEKLRAAVWQYSRPTPAADGTRDPRSATKRNADALERILDERSRTGPASATPPANVNVVVRLRDLLAGGPAGSPNSDADARDWPFYLSWTGPISHSLARLLSCDANLNPVIVDEHGVPLAMGRTVRLATAEQRAALRIRDRCCIKCGRAAQFCEAHHIVFWERGGPTDLTNLALVCGDCHNDIHYRGWDIALGDDGHPRVIPPSGVDPERRPLLSYHRRRRRAG